MVVVGWVTLVPRGAELEVMSHALKGATHHENHYRNLHRERPQTPNPGIECGYTITRAVQDLRKNTNTS